jgi:hypothetical protein
MSNFKPTDFQVKVAEKVGYVINGDDKYMLRGKIGYVIDTAKSGDESFSVKADWIGPDGATDCEIRLWAALCDALI